MGASFRNIGQITHLAGCDLLTISPELLAELQANSASLTPALTLQAAKEAAKALQLNVIKADEASFRYQLHQDAMATEKLSEGIRLFCADIEKLEKVLAS
jgi:transaldolase